MQAFTHVVRDPAGIHAGPAGRISRKCKEFPETVFTIVKDGRRVNMAKLMALMGMGISGGDTVAVEAEGGDEAAALASMQAFLSENL